MESTADPVHSDADALRARSLGLLDFPTVREQVAEHATFGPARELALRLTPAYTSHEVEILQRETAEGIVFLEETGDISLHDAGDVSPAVERAALQGMLTGLELLAVAALLDVQRRARSALLRAQARLPILSGMLEGIPDLLDLERQVRSCIGGRGEVLDTATPSLGALRRQVREASERLTSALEHIIDSPVGREALQDRVISIRGDRLVLQVRDGAPLPDSGDSPGCVEHRGHALYRAILRRRPGQRLERARAPRGARGRKGAARPVCDGRRRGRGHQPRRPGHGPARLDPGAGTLQQEARRGSRPVDRSVGPGTSRRADKHTTAGGQAPDAW